MSGSESDLELIEIQEYLEYLSKLKTSEGFRELFQTRRCHLLCEHCDMDIESNGSEIRENVWAQRKAKFCSLIGKLATQRFAYAPFFLMLILMSVLHKKDMSACELIFAGLSACLFSNFLQSWERSFQTPYSE